MTALSSVALALSLTGCIQSGNIVGKATFTDMGESAIGAATATIDINGGIIATPKGLRFRIVKADLKLGDRSFSAVKANVFVSDPIPRSVFVDSRLKGKNACGHVSGSFSTGEEFFITLYDPPVVDLVDYPNSQTLTIFIVGVGTWFGYAPANSLQIGGRNLCGIR